MEATLTDVELVRQAVTGDRRSLGTLIERAGDRVNSHLNRGSLDTHSAADLTQETVVAILQSLSRLRQAERFWPWVYRIAASKTRQRWRYESRRPAVHLSSLGDVCDDRDRGFGDGYAAAERSERDELMAGAMSGITDRYRLVLRLRYFDGKSHAEIADLLGCSESAARTTLFRAKRALREELKRRGLNEPTLAA